MHCTRQYIFLYLILKFADDDHISVPPTIVDGRSSNDLVVREKDRVNLTCEARGYPEPQILWRREDGKPIMASGMANDKGEGMSNRINN